MSKASEWAKKLADASLVVEKTMEERPQPSPQVYVSGLNNIYFAVDTEGHPLMYVDTKPHDIRWAEDFKRLLDLARWILDTFGEEKT